MRNACILVALCAVVCAQPQKKVTLQKFGEGDLLVVRTQKGFTTLIEFPEGQSIVEVTCGDKDYWVIEGKGRFLHVKPAKEGTITNLNVLLEGDVVYSFLLKEISKTINATPDLRVVVNGGDELAKLRGDRDKLEEAVAKSEHALKELSDKYDTEKRRNLAKETAAPAGARAENRSVTAAAPANPPLAPASPDKPGGAAPDADTGTASGADAPAPLTPAVDAAGEKPIASTYVVERKSGLLRAGGRLLKRVFLRVNNLIHIY